MASFVDAYAVLGVPAEADQDTLKAAHRRLVRRHHPDLVPPDERSEATRRVQEINVAYGLVRDREKRARYDALRQAAQRSGVGSSSGSAPAVVTTQWDAAIHAAGRWAGEWWRHNREPVRRAALGVRSAYGRMLRVVGIVVYTWVGLITGAALQLLFDTGGSLAAVAGGVGGAIVGDRRGRNRLRRWAGEDSDRRMWAWQLAWAAAIGLGLLFDLRR